MAALTVHKEAQQYIKYLGFSHLSMFESTLFPFKSNSFLFFFQFHFLYIAPNNSSRLKVLRLKGKDARKEKLNRKNPPAQPGSGSCCHLLQPVGGEGRGAGFWHKRIFHHLFLACVPSCTYFKNAGHK